MSAFSISRTKAISDLSHADRLLSRMFEHLMSRWRKFRLWQKARPSSSCFMKDAMWRSPNDTSPDSSNPIKSWSMYSNTK